VFFLDRVQGPQSIRLRSLAGNKLPAYCTSIGKVLLAHLSEEDLDAFLKTVKLEPVMPNTITDPDRLRRHLEVVKAQGYAIDNIEYEPEVKSAACPVFDNKGSVVAAISIAGPVFRMSQKRMNKEIIPALIRTADRISARLGYQGAVRNAS
jgi:DNA-binding IclR family transcriptional regulator